MHKPVMLNEVIEYLNIKPKSEIIDATLNGGGHSFGILEKFSDVKIVGIEWDPEIFQEAELRIKNSIFGDRLKAVNESYIHLKSIVENESMRPDAVLFDLGVSSAHYEKSGRGFTFQKDEPLDMRFNSKEEDQTAADIVNKSGKGELEEILKNYGEEKFYESIASGIVRARSIKPIVTTKELTEVINASVPGWYKKRKINPATKTFQALRIAVNHELENVFTGVISAIDVLKSGGRLVVISFHGLEDKIVKDIFNKKIKEGIIRRAVAGTIKPEWDEVKNNPRSRSAKMKVAEKI